MVEKEAGLCSSKNEGVRVSSTPTRYRAITTQFESVNERRPLCRTFELTSSQRIPHLLERYSLADFYQSQPKESRSQC